MSQAELQRFVDTVRSAPLRLDSYTAAASAGEVAAMMRRDGYDVTDAEVEAACRRGTELSDEQLDHVAGGSLLAVGIVGVMCVGLALAVGATASTIVMGIKGHHSVD